MRAVVSARAGGRLGGDVSGVARLERGEGGLGGELAQLGEGGGGLRRVVAFDGALRVSEQLSAGAGGVRSGGARLASGGPRGLDRLFLAAPRGPLLGPRGLDGLGGCALRGAGGLVGALARGARVGEAGLGLVGGLRAEYALNAASKLAQRGARGLGGLDGRCARRDGGVVRHSVCRRDRGGLGLLGALKRVFSGGGELTGLVLSARELLCGRCRRARGADGLIELLAKGGRERLRLRERVLGLGAQGDGLLHVGAVLAAIGGGGGGGALHAQRVEALRRCVAQRAHRVGALAELLLGLEPSVVARGDQRAGLFGGELSAVRCLAKGEGERLGLALGALLGFVGGSPHQGGGLALGVHGGLVGATGDGLGGGGERGRVGGGASGVELRDERVQLVLGAVRVAHRLLDGGEGTGRGLARRLMLVQRRGGALALGDGVRERAVHALGRVVQALAGCAQALALLGLKLGEGLHVDLPAQRCVAELEREVFERGHGRIDGVEVFALGERWSGLRGVPQLVGLRANELRDRGDARKLGCGGIRRLGALPGDGDGLGDAFEGGGAAGGERCRALAVLIRCALQVCGDLLARLDGR